MNILDQDLMMTSGNFSTFPVSSIWVDREHRQRREVEGVEELADSINRVGLIHPITIKKDGQLIVGECRWNAVKLLGWDKVPVQFLEDLNELELKLVELEENTRRKNLPWQDECKAVAEYDALRKSMDAAWTQERTAETLGISRSKATEQIQVAKQLEAGNEMVTNAPRYTIARGIVAREVERKKASVLDTAIPLIDKREAPLLNADFIEWSKSYAGPKFNFIHCDFPYGVDADSHNQGAAASFGGYKDDANTYWRLLDNLRGCMDNVVAQSAHLMFWFSMKFYQETSDKLNEMGWRVNPFPLIWHKSDNMGILPDPSRGPRQIYETCFIASRGDRKIIRAVSNVIAAPTTKEIHMSEKPQNVLEKFFEMFVDENSTVLDPTCGSATAIRASVKRGAAHSLGIERDQGFYEKAKERFFK